METLTDAEAILKIKNGEINYFSVLVRKYTTVIKRFISHKLFIKDDTDDIVQNTFINFYKSLYRFDHTRPVLPYLYQIAKNELKMYFRAHKQAVSLNEDIELQDLEDHDVLDNYAELINVLDPEQKKIIQLLYEGYTYKEIGDALHKPENTIKTIIRRLRLAVANTGDAQT